MQNVFGALFLAAVFVAASPAVAKPTLTEAARLNGQIEACASAHSAYEQPVRGIRKAYSTLVKAAGAAEIKAAKKAMKTARRDAKKSIKAALAEFKRSPDAKRVGALSPVHDVCQAYLKAAGRS